MLTKRGKIPLFSLVLTILVLFVPPCYAAEVQSQSSFTLFDYYDFVSGPAFLAAVAVFAAGFSWKIFRFLRLTVPYSRRTRKPVPASAIPLSASVDRDYILRGKAGLGKAFSGLRLDIGHSLRSGLLGSNPAMSFTSLAFHLVLFLTPLLLPGHTILIDLAYRVSLPSLPEPLLDAATTGLLAILILLILRRALVPRVRAITGLGDAILLLVVAAPFVSAWIAYHQIGDYRTALVTHMAIGDLAIAALPFTKLGHMPFLLLSRFFLDGERAWWPANRRWRAT